MSDRCSLASRVGWGLLLVVFGPFAVLGFLLDRLAWGLGFAIHRIACAVGWHWWFWEPWLRVPYYGVGAWKCIVCRAVKVKP